MASQDAFLLAGAACIVAASLWFAVRGARQRSLAEAVGRKTRRAVAVHAEALSRRRAVLVRVDDYGVSDASRWSREIDHFVSNVVLPLLSPAEARLLAAREIELKAAIDRQVVAQIPPAAGELVETLAGGEVDGLSPAAFEAACAHALAARGWSARTTALTGDQGADIIAEKDGVRLIVQCKLLGRPVGNKAVQEAHAARTHFGARHAAVVSNADFTRGARDLAATTGVVLLHHSQLGEIERHLRVG
ncbi:restriction endonuclease [Enterovirga sp.]|uniref:restriction endonuclease n=1 Tax=Enterovirga sp. TaxID=2026350 RepID=UPI002B531011|nr:restriction endonuclease [Enterovirga sp.]HMO29336.1 restriction endonuclease [Enterovirga sp.]